MNNQRRTILGAAEYSLQTIADLKKSMIASHGDKNQDATWAIGGIVITLTSNLIQICDKVFNESVQGGQPNAKQDIKQILDEFSQFVNRMVDND